MQGNVRERSALLDTGLQELKWPIADLDDAAELPRGVRLLRIVESRLPGPPSVLGVMLHSSVSVYEITT